MNPGDVDPLKDSKTYKKVHALSNGAFGFVQLARNQVTNELVAVKFIERGERVNRYVEAEILNHRMLRHPHVIEYKEVFLTPEYISIVMEYASGGNLFSYVQRAIRLKEPASRWFFQQLIIGLDYCHQKGVVNRDIKLENTLLQMVPGLPLPLLKICDFGYSKAQFMSAPKSKVGTLAYMAPEVIKTTGNYDGKLADIWSCGVMLYVMLFGQYPFEADAGGGGERNRVEAMMRRIVNMQWSMPAGVEISAQVKDLLSKLLVADPAKRLSMQDIQRHPWFLTHLPPDALTMNTNFLTNTDYTGVQSVDAIGAILAKAQVPGPGKYSFKVDDNDFEDVIDDAIDAELKHGVSSMKMPAPAPRGIPDLI
jgi:serine/threonine-protein kinase SRK2